jgi:hypothetical protein
VSEQIAARYRRFAEVEAHGRSPLYEAFALGVAGDTFALDFLDALSDEKRQPNLLFAALRHVCGTPRDWSTFRTKLRDNAPAVRETMLARRTQTNEAGRCATLLPVLARLPQPLALIEVGASAGLCLLTDRYGYDYGKVRLAPVWPIRRRRCLRRIRVSFGVSAWISIRWMWPTRRTAPGSRRWCGPNRRIGCIVCAPPWTWQGANAACRSR